jgi:predicted ATP-grasp superfamily ATP-dependent carboligase
MEAQSMSNAVDLWERPEAEEIYMIAGWRQWADAGSISSGLPRYLIKKSKARQIGTIRPDGFYLFQFPGTHDLVRPVVKFNEGFPVSLTTPSSEIFYTGDERRGYVFLTGDEPHLDAERYVAAFLDIARELNVKRIVTLGGVYGELPYDKERMVSCIYSLPHLQPELENLAVSMSDYHGGASIGSYICKRASEKKVEHVSFYSFVPTYDFSSRSEIGNSIRIENDYVAWLGVMRRVIFMLRMEFDLSGLERKAKRLITLVDAKVKELDEAAPQLGVREYLDNLSEEFAEVTFQPLDDVWEEEFRRLFEDEE